MFIKTIQRTDVYIPLGHEPLSSLPGNSSGTFKEAFNIPGTHSDNYCIQQNLGDSHSTTLVVEYALKSKCIVFHTIVETVFKINI